ncbi:unnamed protein product (macronuclear) [Paramecium tetraurelia]|uniref:MORN repeat protein n=1 Tax=Paramecium tetraurelia TaxID=5888 RepID=A0CPU2_PARTE|nr:uncharacterized protein GSPATT00009201001 [Paramecium tetraurelia]CAK72809.1 unnamed protein product [Paramecium tetraurelia]|eukprot:XP_001440206.1 hypothetical protein (macronuclear) [Paramecium tetraurelia strain d4-2]
MNNSGIIQIEFQNGIYQGQTVQNKCKQGMGVYIWEDGCAYYGEWKSDEIDGQGIFFIPPKTQIMGHFKKTQINGNCILSTCQGTYYGQWNKGQPVEFITAKLQNLEMNIYFQNGKPITHERKYTSKFEIPILKNKINDVKAIQQLELKNGSFYGITSKNQLNQMIPNGLGIFKSSDGVFCSGQFKDGFLNGVGRLYNQTGDVYTGQFEHGEYHGRGIYLSKKDGLQWTKGIWRLGDLIEVHQNGILKNFSSSKEIMFPYSDHKNHIQVQQPININEIKYFEEQILSYIQKSVYSSTNTSPDVGKNQTKITRNYFSNSPKTSYEKISEILFGTKLEGEKQHALKLKQIQQQKNNQLIQYYKDQCQQIEDTSKIQHFTTQSNEPKISHIKMKTHFIETSNMREEIKRQLNSNFNYPNKNQEIKYLQILQQEQNAESQIKVSTNLKSERNNRLKTQLQLKSQLQDNNNKIKQNVNIKEPLLVFKKQKTQDSPRIPQNQLVSKTERNNSNQQQSAEAKIGLKKQKCQNLSKNQYLDNLISIKDDNLENDKFTFREKQIKEQGSIQRQKSQKNKQNYPQNQSSKTRKDPKIVQNQITIPQVQQKQSIETESSSRRKQDIDQTKKLSFSQQDFANNFDPIKSTEIKQSQQSNIEKDLKPIVYEKHEDQNQITLIQKQQLYLEQIIDQQKQQLENLKKEQQLLDNEYQNFDIKSKFITITNGSIDSFDSNPQYSESFNQDFIKSVKDIMRFELKRKQGDSIKDSPHFEQSKITNNQQSLFSNDIQSFENVNYHDKTPNTIKIQNEDNIQQKVELPQSKKEIVSQRDLDDLLFDNSQIKQSRLARRTKSSKYSTVKNQQEIQKIQNNQSLQNHSFHQSQEQLSKNFENDYMDFNKQGMHQNLNQDQIKKQNQEILIQENSINQSQSIHKKSISLIQLQDIQNVEFQNQVIKQQQHDYNKKKNITKESEKQQSINSLKQIASLSQHSSCIQNNQQNKQIQFQMPQKSQNVQVSNSQEGKNTQQDIDDIKIQLEAQQQILASLQNQILQSQPIKFTESKVQNAISHAKSKSELPNFLPDPRNSPIKKVIITKGQFPAFSIIKPITPIRF